MAAIEAHLDFSPIMQNRIDIYYSILNHFLDIIGEVIDYADQSERSKYALRKLPIYFLV